MTGYHGDRVQFRCVDCGEMQTFCEKDLMRAYRSAIMQGGWEIAGYETPRGHEKKAAPKMHSTWRCVTCALVTNERFNEARMAGGGAL